MTIYYISYIVKKSGYYNSHASLMLTEHNPPEPPKITHQYGMYGAKLKWYQCYANKTIANFCPESTVEIVFGATKTLIYHKSWEITEAQKDIIDQRCYYYAKFARTYKYHGNSPEGTILFRAINLNCKYYALKILTEAGINVSDLSNTFFQNPARDIKKMHRLTRQNFTINPDSNSAIGLIYRIDNLSQQLSNTTPIESNKIITLYKLRQHVLQDMLNSKSDLDAVPCISFKIYMALQECTTLSSTELSYLYDRNLHNNKTTEFYWNHKPVLTYNTNCKRSLRGMMV